MCAVSLRAMCSQEDYDCTSDDYVLVSRESQEPNSIISFLHGVFENEMSEYSLIHEWIDMHHPEPAWKRKRNPVNVCFELKCFVVLVYLCGYGQLLLDTFRQIMSRNSVSG